MKLTEWYPPHIKPVRVGEYFAPDFEYRDGDLRWWNGTEWSIAYGRDEEESTKECLRKNFAGQLRIYWRGATKEQK